MNEVINYYDKLADEYDNDRFNNTYGKFIDRQERKILDKLTGNKTGNVVLDLACGTGRLLNYADIGIDGSSEMLKTAKQKHPHKEIYQANAGNLPLENNSVDTIISFHFFMHLDQQQMKTILNECARILKQNGRIIFDIPSKKRRNIINYQAENWHASFSSTFSDIKKLCGDSFRIRKTFGIMFLPIHRLPKGIRKYFNKIDSLISKSFLKEYSSYLIIELVKLDK